MFFAEVEKDFFGPQNTQIFAQDEKPELGDIYDQASEPQFGIFTSLQKPGLHIYAA